jgi:acyl-CoA thioesterase FadM
MGRIKVDINGKKLFQTCIPVRITDLNYGQHLGNDAMVSILHEARLQWLTFMDATELKFHGTSLIMAGLMVEYNNESFYGDRLEICLYAGQTSAAGFELYYEVSCVRKGLEVLICKAKTDMVCFDYSNRKICELPATVAAILK